MNSILTSYRGIDLRFRDKGLKILGSGRLEFMVGLPEREDSGAMSAIFAQCLGDAVMDY